MMDNVQYSKEILEAISHLRHRKARPDISRITMYLFKKYGLSYDIVAKSLVDCVKKSLVLEVEYKGYISYRDASKTRNYKKHSLKYDLIVLMLQTFDALVDSMPVLSKTGLTVQKFKESLLITNTLQDDYNFDALLDKGIKLKIFSILPNGNVMATKYIKDENSDNKYTSLELLGSKQVNIDDSSEYSSQGNTENNSEDDLLYKKLVDEDVEQNACVICLELFRTHNENVIFCRQCLNKSHLKCAFANKKKSAFEWNCPECIICSKCKKRSAINSLITCMKCNIAYHKQCHIPKLQESLNARSFWICNLCGDESDENNVKAKSTFFCKPGHIPKIKYDPHEHTAIWKHFKQRNFDFADEEEIDYSIPDASSWTSNQVYTYLFSKFPEGALPFKSRNIDGLHLLNMSRTEIIQGLGLKLGPALKVYKEVIILQKRRNDSKLYYL